MSSIDLLREEIRNSVPITEVIGKYVRLERSGSNFKGLCPFHNEKTPSFFVSPTKKIFKCFGCGEGGDVISFLQKYENISFWEAVRKLADEYGIDISQYISQRDDQKGHSSTEKLKRANIVAMEFFASNLFSDIGKQALEYLHSRNVDDTTARIFRLGYAPNDESLISYAQKRGVPPEALIEVGLAKRSPDGSLIPFFRNRVIFPIFDRGNIPIGFAGRAIEPDDEPKYLNITNTPIYDKSKAFYGINVALPEIIRSQQAIIVEGYMDVIGFYKAGIKRSIATCGTALTEDHAKILRTIAPQVILAYDSDEAGMKARYQSALILLKHDIIPLTIAFPEGEDPDSYVNKHGTQALQQLIEQPIDFIEFWLNKIWREDLSPNQQAEAIREILQLVAAIPDSLKAEGYIRLVATKTGMDIKLIKKELRKIIRSNVTSEQMSFTPTPQTTSLPQKPVFGFLKETTKFILKFGFHKVKISEQTNQSEESQDEKLVRDLILDSLDPILISYDPIYEEILQLIKNLTDPPSSPEDLPLSEEARKTFWHLIDSPAMLEQLFQMPINTSADILQDIKRIKNFAKLLSLQLKRKEIQDRLKDANAEEKQQLYAQIWDLSRQINKLLKETGLSISIPID
ncbi:MAG: DNA primase [Chlorobi bacterium]|nr:DNA primase [Chlorobiota bacterium]